MRMAVCDTIDRPGTRVTNIRTRVGEEEAASHGERARGRGYTPGPAPPAVQGTLDKSPRRSNLGEGRTKPYGRHQGRLMHLHLNGICGLLRMTGRRQFGICGSDCCTGKLSPPTLSSAGSQVRAPPPP